MPSKRSRRVHIGAVVGLAVALAIGLLSRSSVQAPTSEPEVAPPPALTSSEARTWKKAAQQVEEKRGEPTGMAAAVQVPAELRHYAERRRFLAVQVAETQEQDVDLPHDEAALIEQIQAGKLVRMGVLGDDYILYGVGASATGEPFAHWDERTGARIPLFDGWGDADDAEQEVAAQVAAKKDEAAARRAELRRIRVSTRTRTRRRQLQAQIRTADREAAALETRRKQLAAWYDDYDRRRLLVGEYGRIQEFARDAGGRSYDLLQPSERRLMRARLLAYVRPEARDVILELARRYHERFNRPLAVTSLVRTEAYQLQLGRTNPNATTIDSPPHATGLAFDVHYGHLTAAEQEAVMDDLRQWESDGRVEALRETRNHFHVFVFPDGQRPSEQLITASLDDVRPGRVVQRTSGGSRSKVAASRARRAASVKKAPARKAAVRRAPARKAPARKAARKPSAAAGAN
jgi:uncharacterized protein DUF5715